MQMTTNSLDRHTHLSAMGNRLHKRPLRTTQPAHDTQSNEPRSAVLLVRSLADLEHANGHLVAYLSSLWRRTPAGECARPLGIWIDPDGVENPPLTLKLPDCGDVHRTVPVTETTGISGIWTLCWLETAARTLAPVDLATALLDYYGYEDPAAHAERFTLIVPGDVPAGGIRSELQKLKARYPSLLLPPIYQRTSGCWVI